MATAKEFLTRLGKVDGVAGCLLVRGDGALLGQTLVDSEVYSTLLVLIGSLGRDVMETAGFSDCRHICFNRRGKCDFYVFPIDNYLLGVVQGNNRDVSDMLEAVHRLIGRVSTNNSMAGRDGN